MAHLNETGVARLWSKAKEFFAPKEHTHSAFVKSGSGAKEGFVPAPPITAGYAKYLREDGTWEVPTDTKNTAGATDTSNKIFLVGATSQGGNKKTYSHDTAYVGEDGCLYSGGKKVLSTAGGEVQYLDVKDRIICGYDSGQPNSVNSSNWFRSSGNTGWINETYGGGWWMQDSTWLKSYNNKNIYTGGIVRADAGFRQYYNGGEYGVPCGNGVYLFSDGASYLHVETTSGAFGINWWASDIKLKKNIKETLINALEKINEIEFVEFDWKSNDKNVPLGVIANQLETIIPEAVFDVEQSENSEFDSLKQIDTSTLLSYSLKAIQELSAKVEELTQRIEKLETDRNE